MTEGWIKLTPQQNADINALTATNPSNMHVAGTPDINGDFWLSADCLDECAPINPEGIFQHYSPVLSTLTVTQLDPPTWPEPEDL